MPLRLPRAGVSQVRLGLARLRREPKSIIDNGKIEIAEGSTGTCGSLDSMGPLSPGGPGFPLRITEFIGPDMCGIQLESAKLGCTGVDRGTIEECGTAPKIFECKSHGGTISHCIERLEQTLTRTLKGGQHGDHTPGRGPTETVDISGETNVGDSVTQRLSLEEAHLHEDLRIVCDRMLGKWETMLDHSDPLDPLFKRMGIGYVKRFVVDKLALEVALTFEDDHQYLQMELNVPFGVRRMRWDLHGQTMTEVDPDCGSWDGHVTIKKVDLGDLYNTSSKSQTLLRTIIDSLPSGQATALYAPVQTRLHKTIGIVNETRFVLHSQSHGKLLVLKYWLTPHAKGTPVVVTRVCRQV